MAVKISELPAAVAAAGTNLLAAVQSGVTRRITFTELGAWILSAYEGFIQLGTGALATTLQDKNRRIIDIKDFATLDGITDDAAGINAAFIQAATFTSAEVRFPPGSKAVCNSGLTVDLNKVKVTGNGCQLDFSGMSSGDAWAVSQSNADANVRQYLNMVHPIEGLVLIGPGVATTAVRAVQINDASSPNSISGVTFRGCSFVNFAKDVNFGSGAFNCLFDDCDFTKLSGTSTTYSVEILTGTTNAGERNEFRSCVWHNKNYIFNQTNGNADTFFNNCSLDGFSRAFTVTAGQVYINDPHIETTDDTDYGFHITGQSTLLQIYGGNTQLSANKDTKSLFYSDSGCVQGGIVLRDHGYFFSGSTHVQPIIDGTGRTAVNGLTQYYSSVKPNVSSAQNALAYGGFESANYTAEWTLAGGNPAVRSNAQARTGTYSLSFPGAVGNTPSAYALIPCLPGQTVQGEYWYLVSSITGTSGAFYIQVDFLDKGGNVISNAYGVNLTTTDVAAWTQARLNLHPAPGGTVSVKILFNVNSVASGTPTAYIDDVSFCTI